MNKTIWKFFLAVTDLQFVTMPAGAEVLSVQEQQGGMSLWALVDPGRPPETRKFAIYGTGHVVPANPGRYIGTAQQFGGALAWHVFEPAA